MLMFTSTSRAKPAAGYRQPPLYALGGQTAVTGTSTNISATATFASRFTVPQSGKLVAFRFFSWFGTVNVRFGVYSNNGSNLPENLLTQAEGTTPGSVSVWTEYPLAEADYLDVALGDQIWIAIQGASSLNTRTVSGSVAHGSRSRNVTYASGLPNPFGSTGNPSAYALGFKIWTNA